MLTRANRRHCKRQIMFGGRMLNEKLWRARNQTDMNGNSRAKAAKGGTHRPDGGTRCTP